MAAGGDIDGTITTGNGNAVGEGNTVGDGNIVIDGDDNAVGNTSIRDSVVGDENIAQNAGTVVGDNNIVGNDGDVAYGTGNAQDNDGSLLGGVGEAENVVVGDGNESAMRPIRSTTTPITRDNCGQLDQRLEQRQLG